MFPHTNELSSTWVSTLAPILLHLNYWKQGKQTTTIHVCVDEGDKLALPLQNSNFLNYYEYN